MRVQLKLLSVLLFVLSGNLWANEDTKKIQELFKKYDQIVVLHKVQLFPEVFTTKFLAEQGGEKSYATTVTSAKEKAVPFDLDIKPGRLDKSMAFVKIIPKGSKLRPESSFVVKRNPSGEWRIEGTVGDEN